jgi:hypothetical protein
MPTPVISRVIPPQLSPDAKNTCGTRIWIQGAHFSPNATAEIIGNGIVVQTIRLADDLLECRIDARDMDGDQGVIVLNEPAMVLPATSSKIFVVPYRTGNQLPMRESSVHRGRRSRLSVIRRVASRP